MPTPSQPLPYATPANPNLHPLLRRAANHLLLWAIFHFSIACLFALFNILLLLVAILTLVGGSFNSNLCCFSTVGLIPLIIFSSLASRCKDLRRNIISHIPGTLDSALTLLYLFLIPTAAILLACLLVSYFLLSQTPYDVPALTLFVSTFFLALLITLQLLTLITLYRARRVEPPLTD